MSHEPTAFDAALQDYVRNFTLNETDVMHELREETQKHQYAMMQILPEQGQFMRMLTQLCGVRKGIEIGVFTGYSALCVAMELPDDGKLIACDLTEEFVEVGKPYWERAGVAHKIDLRIGRAMDTLDELLADPEELESFDYFFIDADKQYYHEYYEKCLKLCRKGGLIILDNVFWSGRIVDPGRDLTSNCLNGVNRFITQDKRVFSSMVPIGDGMLLCRKKG